MFQIIVFRNNDLSAVVIFPKESACSSISLSRTCGPGQRLEGTGRGGASRGGRRLGGIAVRPGPGAQGLQVGRLSGGGAWRGRSAGLGKGCDVWSEKQEEAQ